MCVCPNNYICVGKLSQYDVWHGHYMHACVCYIRVLTFAYLIWLDGYMSVGASVMHACRVLSRNKILGGKLEYYSE